MSFRPLLLSTLLAALLLAPLAHAAESGSQRMRYVGEFYEFSRGDDGGSGHSGCCSFTYSPGISPAGAATLVVEDLLMDEVTFHWTAGAYIHGRGYVVCAQGVATDAAAFDIPDGCNSIKIDFLTQVTTGTVDLVWRR